MTLLSPSRLPPTVLPCAPVNIETPADPFGAVAPLLVRPMVLPMTLLPVALAPSMSTPRSLLPEM